MAWKREEIRSYQDKYKTYGGWNLFKVNGEILSIKVYENSQQLSLSSWYDSTLRGKEFSGSSLEPAGEGIRTIKNNLLAGKPSLEVIGEVMGDTVKRVFVENGKFVIGLSTTWFSELYQKPPIINQILSSFKFIP